MQPDAPLTAEEIIELGDAYLLGSETNEDGSKVNLVDVFCRVADALDRIAEAFEKIVADHKD